MRRAMARAQTGPMHSEYIQGLTIRPMMDAGYTAWRDGERVGIVRLVDGEIDVEASDPFVERVLVERLRSDLSLVACASSSQEPREPSGVRSFASFWTRVTKSAA